MRFIHFFTVLFVFYLCITGCNIINPKEDTPTYIHIDSFHFVNNNPARNGSSAQNINTVFAYYNGISIGVFDLPATFPVLANGSGTLTLEPGISVNGMKDKEFAYTFFKNGHFTFSAAPGTVINATPQTEYIDSGINFVKVEDFDNGNNFIKFSGDSTMYFDRIADSVFEGTGSAKIHLTYENDSCEIVMQDGYELTDYYTFCELHYKSDVPIYIGMLLSLGGTPSTYISYILGIKSSNNEWKKIYVHLGSLITTYPGGKYYLGFKAIVPPGQTNGTVYLDNIKIVTKQ